MPMNAPNLLTLLRLALIPVLVAIYYLPFRYTFVAVTAIWIVAGVTDWLDGYLARRLSQSSAFGAFLDPVADKLIVATALILLATDARILEGVIDPRLFGLVILVIIGREIAISALREWMALLGKRARVAVTAIGKYKTALQMVAIGMLLWREPLLGLPILRIGELMLYAAGALTVWSMLLYLRAALPILIATARREPRRRGAARTGPRPGQAAASPKPGSAPPEGP
jgi:CDP-diacylglycerol---glycerol-3-phosphate 3-phosphatidyltransferase